MERDTRERLRARAALGRALDDPDPAAVIAEMRGHLGPQFKVEHGIRETTTADGRMLVFYVRLSDAEESLGVEATSEVPEALLTSAGDDRADFERGLWSALCYRAPLALFERLSDEVLGDG